MTSVTHWCGCITKDKQGVIFVNKICPLHQRQGGAEWIVVQHDRMKEDKKNDKR